MFLDRSYNNRWILGSRQRFNIIMHVTMFWCRTILFGMIYIYVSYLEVSSPSIYTDITDFDYLWQLNLFLIFLSLSATIGGNVFKYYIAILMMLHNTGITMVSLKYQKELHSTYYWIVWPLISGLYLLEALFSSYLIYLNRYEINMDLFKRIGINPVVNDAFSTRKRLEAFGEINLFMSIFIILKFWIPAPFNSTSLFCAELGNAGLTIIQQLSISIFYNEEIIIQRKIAIFLTIIKIPFCILLIVWELIDTSYSTSHIYHFYTFVFIDILVLTSFMLYFLISDYLQFGSGLKEYLKFKTARISLKTNPSSNIIHED